MSVTPDTPDFAGTVIAATGQLVATLVFAAGNPGPQNVTVPAWASSLELHGVTPPLGTHVQVAGGTSAISYLDTNQGFGLLQFPLKVDIPPAVDATVIVHALSVPAGGLTIYVVARDDQSGLNSTSQPVIVDQLNFDWSGFTATAPSGTSASLLAAPVAGFAWELGVAHIHYSAAVTAAAVAVIRGHTSGQTIIGVAGLTGSLPFDNVNCERVLAVEAVDLFNVSGGVNAVANLWARQVLLYYNNSV